MHWFVLVFLILFSVVTLGKAKEPILDRAIKEVPGGMRGEIHDAETPTIAEFFKAHCTKCHNADKKKGGIIFLELTDFRLENAKHWHAGLGIFWLPFLF